LSLRHKTALLVLIFTIANVSVGFGIHRALVAPEFAALEQSEAAKNMARVEQAIQREISHLEEFAEDWASWDETYAFVASGDPGYVKRNLGLDTLASIGIDGVLVLDLDARMVASAVFDPVDQTPLVVPELSEDAFDPSHVLLSNEDEWRPVSGIMATSRGPVLVASRYVFDTEGVKPTRGHLVTLRFLHRDLIAALSQRTGISFDIWPVDSPDAPASTRTALLRRGADRLVSVLAETEDRLNVSTLLADLQGVPAVIVQADLPRDIAKRGEAVSELTLIVLLLQGAALALLMMIALSRSILKPIAALSRHLQAIQKTKDLSIRVGTQRGDEIGELSRDFDRMLSQLEEQILERKRGQAALLRSEERLREAQAVAHVGGWEFDVAKDVLWWSDELFRMHDLDPAESTPTLAEFLNFVHPEDRPELEAIFESSLQADAQRVEAEVRIVTASGQERRHHLIWNTEFNDAGAAQRFFGTATDVTARHGADEAIRRAAAVFDTATEGIAIAGTDGRILDVNAAFSAITGYSSREAIGQTRELLDSGRHDKPFLDAILDTVRLDGKWEGEIWIRHKLGRAIPAWVSIGRTLGDKGDSEQLVFVFNDMTERKESEELISRQANFDMLTGIPNRSLFTDRLARETRVASREHTTLALFYLDLDDFKAVNDTHGHAAGDEVLRQAALRIQDCVRDVDTVARIGGDEFAVIAPQLGDPMDAEVVAERILTALALPHPMQGQDSICTASIGITLFPRDADDDESLLRNADVAMYRAKEAGGNSRRFFTADMNASALRRTRVEAQLAHALERGEFWLNYQPIVALPEGRLVGVEALLRWKNDELGEISPDEFIQIAERKGFIVGMGEWVVRSAWRQVKAWQEAVSDSRTWFLIATNTGVC